MRWHGGLVDIVRVDESFDENKGAARTRARIRRRTFEVLEVAAPGDQLSRLVDIFVAALVAGNVIAVVLESVEPVYRAYHDLFVAFEQVSIVSFSAEFVLRLWASAESRVGSESAFQSRMRYLRSPMAIADLLAILPYFLSALFALDLRVLRVLRLLRVFKLTRYSASLGRIFEVVSVQKRGLAMAMLIMVLAIIVTASIVYVVEKDAQPEAFASIPMAMWWAVCTLTTVGYGDVTPVTGLGKFLASLVTLCGIGIVALPTSLMASGFTELANRDKLMLEEEAARAVEDGVLSDEERRAYALLTERLGVDPKTARAIFGRAKHASFDEEVGCPHCGKSFLI